MPGSANFRWLEYSQNTTRVSPPSMTREVSCGRYRQPDGQDVMIQRPRVLIVDNDAAFRGDLMAVLKRDCIVMSASGGMEAYTFALEYHPDVIVSEFHIPGWTGPRLLSQLRQHRILGRVPVIILTADNSRTAVQAALKAGADDYVLKANISPKLLLERIRRAVSLRSPQLVTV